MGAIYKKELRSYFTNMTGYVSIALILLLTGIFVRVICLSSGYPTMEQALYYTSLVLILAVPILAMRSFAEERRQKTDILMYSLPLSTVQIVLGKYLAMLTVLAIPMAVMTFYPLILTLYGTVDLITTYAAILALFLLSASMAGICMFMSSLTESQVIAAVLGISAILLCYTSSLIAGAVPSTAVASLVAFLIIDVLIGAVIYYFTRNKYVSAGVPAVFAAGIVIVYIADDTVFEGLFQKVTDAISLFERFYSFIDFRVIDITGYIYYISVAFLFVFFTVQTVEKRRFN